MGAVLATERPGFHEMEDVSFSDLELVYHLRQALQSVPLGDTDSYDQLIGVLHHKERLAPDEVALFVMSLKALFGAVSCINMVHHKSLLASAASSGDYLDCCLDMLVSNFMPPFSFIDLLKQPRGLSRKDQVLSCLHSTLKDIMIWFIGPNFVYWSMVQTTYDDGEDSSGEEVPEGYEAIHPDCVGNDDEDDAMARNYDSGGIDFGKFDNSMNKMSITPKNSVCYRLGDNLKVCIPSRIRPSTSPESL